jgi:hypothetical protein
LIILLAVFASGGRISTTGIDLAVCRDWVLVIASDPASHQTPTTLGQPNELLTFLTTSLRRITLVCKLLSPLLISFSTTFIGYQTTTAILLGAAGITLASEILWIGVVWRKFKVLEEQEVHRQKPRRTAMQPEHGDERTSRANDDISTSPEHGYSALGQHEDGDISRPLRGSLQQFEPRGGLLRSARKALGTWNEFRKMPVFLSEFRLWILYTHFSFLLLGIADRRW